MEQHDFQAITNQLDVTNYNKAGFPLLYCETYEIKRAIQSITVQEGFSIKKWNCITGLEGTGELTSLPEFLDYACKQHRTTIIAENFNFFFEDETSQQMILNATSTLKNRNVTILVVGADHPKKFPSTLKKCISTIDFPMPDKTVFREIVKNISEQTEIEYDEAVADACIGLTYEEAENALFKSVVDNKAFKKDVIYQMKGDMLKSTGFLRYMNPVPIEELGGLDLIRDYVGKRLMAYDKPELNLPKLRALFLVGVQGCGKSLFAKVLASIFDWPLIECDANAMKGGIVGETEENTRLFIKTVDAFGKAIVLIDEISLVFGGYTSGSVHETGGATSGMLGTLLTWLNDRTSEAIIIATSNDMNLPPAFLRAGR
jgi:ABC-type phosphate transport system ATPase subunit